MERKWKSWIGLVLCFCKPVWDSEENTLVSSICPPAFLKPHQNSIWINRDKQYREVLWDGSCLLDGAHGAQSWDTLRFRIKPECPVKPILPFLFCFSSFPKFWHPHRVSLGLWPRKELTGSLTPSWLWPGSQVQTGRRTCFLLQPHPRCPWPQTLCWDSRGLGWFSGDTDFFTSQRKSLLFLPLITGINPCTMLSAESLCPSIFVKEGRN